MRRQCCIIVMDIRKKNIFYPFHSDIADFMQDIGFIYKDKNNENPSYYFTG